jgi:DNA mismatch repair protein MutS
MKQNKFTDEYFKDVIYYENEYGPNTVVWIEKGEFMELYGIENDNETIGNITAVCELLQISCTRTDNTKEGSHNSRSNPLMAGVPSYSINNHINVLLKHNYTVVMKTQTKKVGKTFERSVTSVLSNGCCITDNMTFESANIVCMITNEHTHFQTKQKIMSIGLALIDVTTGHSTIYEVSDKPNDMSHATNEAYRFIQIANPRQVLAITHNDSVTDHLGVPDNTIRHITKEPKMETLAYQTQFFSTVYQNEPNNVMEYLGLSRYPSATSALMYSLNYVHNHNKSFMNHLQKPVFWNKVEHMMLHHNTIYQLDLISRDPTRQTLCSILNHCRTSPGKRLFEDWLLNPSTNHLVINKRYNQIDSVLEHQDMIPEVTASLKTVSDIERLLRRISISVARPSDVFKIYTSLTNILDITNAIEQRNISEFLYDKPVIQQFIQYIKTTFVLQNIERHTNPKQSISYNIYCPGIHKDIDDVQQEHDDIIAEWDEYVATLNEVAPGNFKVKTEKKGLCLEITKIRFAAYSKSTTLDDTQYTTFDKVTTNTKYKLTNNYINGINRRLEKSTTTMNDLMNEYYEKHVAEMDDLFHEHYDGISTFLATFDVIVNNALMSINRVYKRPVITDNLSGSSSHMNLKGLRHPIVEHIHTTERYVPNDISLGESEHGMVLFGMNASGKSVCLKATGIAVIMAQAGMFVACERMEYSIYTTVMSRILGNDNLTKSLSSFEVEMIELKDILNVSDEQTLVLGDEICRGTENISGLSIVAASIIELSKRHVSFMYTTHLHKLSELQRIKELTNIGIYHLKVTIEDDDIVYDRRLQKGNGETIYGIEVARAMKMGEEFIKMAYEIRATIVGSDNNVLTSKTSRYNSRVIVNTCEICGEPGVDTHHIKFQCTAVDGIIDHYHKHVDHNLVVLCKRCHRAVHRYKYRIDGWKTSMATRTLDYTLLPKSERKAYEMSLGL